MAKRYMSLILTQTAMDRLERNARDAAAEVRKIVKRIDKAIAARERKLLKEIEENRQQKSAILRLRDHCLRSGIARLTHTVDKLRDARNTRSMFFNPYHLFLCQGVAAAEVTHRF